MEEFKTVKENIQTQITEKKSKFITNIYNINSVEEVEEIIKYIKKEYNDARHNCYAYRVDDNGVLIERYSDDGEPSGTAGAPMLNILQKKELYNVLVIVTRYFGGILLGTGGLVRAYSDSITKVMDESIYVKNLKGFEIEISLEYKDLEKFKYYCKKNNIKIVNVEYSDNINIIIEIANKEKEKILENISKNKINIIKSKILREKNIQKNIDI